MRLKRIAATGASAALLAAGLVLGSGGAAQAVPSGCYPYAMGYGWSVNECVTAGTYGSAVQHINDAGASTDVRIYHEFWTSCGGWHIISSNYDGGGIHAWPGHNYTDTRSGVCSGSTWEAHFWETESGRTISEYELYF
ncbi:hypothetical protein ACFW1A_27105 [Kitasatospora sp. NPDC058965]|uniref:hypothetical protein n=1 Tax=Kitasatospora sp. NPDC058965 TaxID=3346682 RepID=UPI00367D5CA2